MLKRCEHIQELFLCKECKCAADPSSSLFATKRCLFMSDVLLFRRGHCRMLRMRADEPLTMPTELPLAPLSTKLFPSVMVSMSLNTLHFVVDCQPVGEIVNGRSPLLAEELRGTFQRITSNLSDILDAGWQCSRMQEYPQNDKGI